MNRRLRILGTRGVPAAHGGFETFAEHLALYLAERGWRVTVYCQTEGRGPTTTDVWRGVQRVQIPVRTGGAAGTIVFDWLATRHAAAAQEPCLTLGYNTALFCALLRLANVPNMINMDGIEWSRAKWGPLAKAWFWLNERAGCWLGDHLIADHPEIKRHLSTRVTAAKITTIPYGADELHQASTDPVLALGLAPGRYLTVIARPEPENSLLEIVTGFSRRRRNIHLAILGQYDPGNAFHRAVQAAASDELRFCGAIYDKAAVQALRVHSLAYVHGHQVGGTNPSLVEALGAGNAVIAHDNVFNRWVAGPSASYFRTAQDLDDIFTTLLNDDARLEGMRSGSRKRFTDGMRWPDVLAQYEALLRSVEKE